MLSIRYTHSCAASESIKVSYAKNAKLHIIKYGQFSLYIDLFSSILLFVRMFRKNIFRNLKKVCLSFLLIEVLSPIECTNLRSAL